MEVQQENFDEHNRRSAAIWDTYPSSDWRSEDLSDEALQDQRDKRNAALAELQEWDKTHPQYITDPIPEDAERQLVVDGQNYKDGKWTRHVLNQGIHL
jgi:hypothetical protein